MQTECLSDRSCFSTLHFLPIQPVKNVSLRVILQYHCDPNGTDYMDLFYSDFCLEYCTKVTMVILVNYLILLLFNVINQNYLQQ